MGDLTFAQGQEIFRQQVPLGKTIYRTFRWGRDLQIWFTDGRDFRSPNDIPDGPEKTIWGTEQKAWLQRTLLESDATWKILISPTPIVGPDRGRGAVTFLGKVTAVSAIAFFLTSLGLSFVGLRTSVAASVAAQTAKEAPKPATDAPKDALPASGASQSRR